MVVAGVGCTHDEETNDNHRHSMPGRINIYQRISLLIYDGIIYYLQLRH